MNVVFLGGGLDLAFTCNRILYIFVQKHPPSLWRSCVPSLIPVHQCSSIIDLWPCHIDYSVGSRTLILCSVVQHQNPRRDRTQKIRDPAVAHRWMRVRFFLLYTAIDHLQVMGRFVRRTVALQVFPDT
jgi:hypothetical protein